MTEPKKPTAARHSDTPASPVATATVEWSAPSASVVAIEADETAAAGPAPVKEPTATAEPAPVKEPTATAEPAPVKEPTAAAGPAPVNQAAAAVEPAAEASATAEAPAVEAFAGIPDALADAIRRRGFLELTSVQRSVLDADSEGRDLRISSQTGSGKTVAIGLGLSRHLCDPAAAANTERRGPTVLILVPTRELAVQVREELRWLYSGVRGVDVAVIMGGTALGPERAALARRPRIVVGTPGRALDHLRNRALVTDSVEHVVLDESDRMLDMGFREDLEAILEELPKQRRTHLISATFPNAVRKLADRFQAKSLHVEGTQLGVANADIEHIAHVVDRRDRYAAIVNLLLLNEGGRCLVFVERRVDASTLAEQLSGDGFPVQAFSGELPQAQRTRTISAFRDGTIKTLISTDVAARGIDVPNIEMVIHSDVPWDADTYVHRSGRTGRAGRAGQSVMLVSPRGQRQMERLLRNARIDAEWKAAPGASRVRKHLRKRFRQELHASLATEEGPSQKQMDYAKKLLDGRDPAEVVALLIEMAQPTPAREPMNISEVSEVDKGRGGHSQATPGFVRFNVNWGARQGCAPPRLLGHICRRGQIRNHHVGGMDIGPDDSSFEISSKVAGRFEKMVRQPDARDPRVRIVRAGGPGRGPQGQGDRGPRGGDHRGPRQQRSRPNANPKGRPNRKPRRDS